MKQSKELYEALKKIFGTESNVIPAVVISVDKPACTCVVEFDELQIEDVRLRAAVSPGGDGVLLFPKVGSAVLVEKIGSKEDYFITMVSEVEEVRWKVDNTTFKVANGFTMTVGSESVRTILVDLMAQIKLLTVPTNVGPSGVPLNAAAFTAIENRIKTVFK